MQLEKLIFYSEFYFCIFLVIWNFISNDFWPFQAFYSSGKLVREMLKMLFYDNFFVRFIQAERNCCFSQSLKLMDDSKLLFQASKEENCSATLLQAAGSRKMRYEFHFQSFSIDFMSYCVSLNRKSFVKPYHTG